MNKQKVDAAFAEFVARKAMIDAEETNFYSDPESWNPSWLKTFALRLQNIEKFILALKDAL